MGSVLRLSRRTSSRGAPYKRMVVCLIFLPILFSLSRMGFFLSFFVWFLSLLDLDYWPGVYSLVM